MEKSKNSFSMRSFGKDITNLDRNEIGQIKRDLKQVKKQKTQKELIEIKKEKLFSKMYDSGQEFNTDISCECIQDILDNMFLSKVPILKNLNFMKPQKYICEKMRALLVNWLIEIHQKFNFLPKTLFLTINIMDKFLEKEVITRNKLQLIGLVALLLASKYEEIYCPKLSELLFICDYIYDQEEIIDMETRMIYALEFNFGIATIFDFLSIFQKAEPLNEKVFFLSLYLIELTLYETKIYKFDASIIAISALILAKKIVFKEDDNYKEFITCREDEKIIRECVKMLYLMGRNAKNPKVIAEAVVKKFSSNKYLQVSNINFD